ncbi:nuclear transport factor 2 family protein [Bacterioplanoides sp. SCSIO 12839]|uniref:nuclear transport factor 2 family protein n=1 Tax=Bacterioplanoides sp. SCSIO 12839 TaxID=2829569 RepID=UPI0021074935|nr:nuclear transport factor 2 family protein [Bacterioplanoides sp. SCSIO 12839]UTW49019.1 nuclear transport factor 2 family protein [Bacterioplanoides sp. SCSIO 12839]
MNKASIHAFQELYHKLNRGQVSHDILASVYDEKIQFRDPFHQVNGLESLTHYFINMYENVEHIEFEFGHSWLDSVDANNHTNTKTSAFIRWQMRYQHPRINSGKTVQVDGGSELIWHNDKIIQHQDFFDGGQMLYEHLPLMGWAIRKLKERMQ